MARPDQLERKCQVGSVGSHAQIRAFLPPEQLHLRRGLPGSHGDRNGWAILTAYVAAGIDHFTDPIFPQHAISLYRGAQFGYVRLEADKKRLKLSYVCNHDCKTHDVVEFTASGQVCNGCAVSDDVVVEVEVGSFDGGSALSWCVKVGSLLVLRASVAYVVGFISRSRSDRAKWAPVKSDDSRIFWKAVRVVLLRRIWFLCRMGWLC